MLAFPDGYSSNQDIPHTKTYSNLHISHFGNPFQTAFPAPAHGAVGNNPAGHFTPPATHGQSSVMQYVSIGTLAVIGSPLPTTDGPPTTYPQVTPQRKFACSLCPKRFDRSSRADACLNAHLGRKPHVCPGTCGNTLWWVNEPDAVMARSWSNTRY